MAEKKMERSDSSSTLDGRSEDWELDIDSKEIVAKLAARVAALKISCSGSKKVHFLTQ
jgi:hypothetical protein